MKRLGWILALAITFPVGAQQAPPPAFESALQALREGRAEIAEAAFQKLAEEGESVRARLYLARLLAQRGDARGALGELASAREAAPNSEEVLSAYARVALGLQEPIPALEALEPLVRMHPGVAEYPYLLGVAWMQAGDMAAAAAVLERAVELEPERALGWIALGLARNGQKRHADARDALLEAVRLGPGNVEALAALAEAEAGVGELEAAERHARRALELHGKDGGSHAAAELALGVVLMKRGQHSAARDALERSVAADPSSAKAHYQLSLAYARLGEEEASREHLALYRRAREEIESRLLELRGQTRPFTEPTLEPPP